MLRNERRDETALTPAAVSVARIKSSGTRVITLVVIALLALIASLCPGVAVAEQRQLTPQESAQLYAHRIWDFSTEENTFSSILWLADVGGQGGWSGPVDLDAHRRIASQCHGEILAYLRSVPPGQLEGRAKGIANLMAHTDRVRMYPDRINMDEENAHPLWPCFARAAGIPAGDFAGAQKKVADQALLRKFIEQSCLGEINDLISKNAGMVSDGGAGERRAVAEEIDEFADNSLEALQGFQHNISAGVPDNLSRSRGGAVYAARLTMWACFFRARAQFEGRQGSIAPQPPPRPNPPVAAAPGPPVPGLYAGAPPQVASMVRNAFDTAPQGWSVPRALLQAPYWIPGQIDERGADLVAAAKGAWIEQALRPACASQYAAMMSSAESAGRTYETQATLGGGHNFSGSSLSGWYTANTGIANNASYPADRRQAAAYAACIAGERLRQIDTTQVAPAYQPLNDQMAQAFQRQQEGRTEKLHNHANDATSCLSVVATGTKVEWGTSGKFKLVNTCGYPVSASWCANTRYCETGLGNLWTIGAGRDYPIFFADPANPDIRVGACRVGAQATNKVDVVANNNGVSMVDTAHDPPQPAPGVSIMQGHKCD